jgi:dTDP-4-amino-4,6-dideoxygalactose transaminase
MHGQGAQRYDVVRIGVNGRLDTIQAAVLLAKLEVFEDELRARERLAGRYDARLSKSVTTPQRVAGAQSAWAQYSILTDRRDELQTKLKAAGVPTAIYYPLPMHLQPAYIAHGKGKGSLPVSERLSTQILALPMHPYLSDADFEKVCSAVEAALT